MDLCEGYSCSMCFCTFDFYHYGTTHYLYQYFRIYYSHDGIYCNGGEQFNYWHGCGCKNQKKRVALWCISRACLYFINCFYELGTCSRFFNRKDRSYKKLIRNYSRRNRWNDRCKFEINNFDKKRLYVII